MLLCYISTEKDKIRKVLSFRSRLWNAWKLPRDSYGKQEETVLTGHGIRRQIFMLKCGTVDSDLPSELRLGWFDSCLFWLVLSLVLISTAKPTTLTFSWFLLLSLTMGVQPAARDHIYIYAIITTQSCSNVCTNVWPCVELRLYTCGLCHC